MYNEVKIGDKTVPMLAMASIDAYYKAIFHEDPIKIQLAASEGDMIDLFMKMGFVMAKFAETKDRKEMLKLNDDSYLAWLEQFTRSDYFNALEDIRATYEDEQVTSSDAKKNNE